jgi:LysR family transcriptional activator of nhaA
MRQWINYHHLLYFKTIAEHESVSKAAAILRLGQPTLSAQLKQFEETIGVPLFLREGKRLRLTEHGKIALEYAKDIFTKGGELSEVLQQRIPVRHATLRLGALDGIAKQILIRITDEARKGHHCRVVIAEGKINDLLWDLDAGRLDLLVTNYLPDGVNRDAFQTKKISRASVGIYAAPSFKSLRTNFPKSISGQPIVLPTYDSQLRHDIDNWGRKKKLLFDVVVETQDIAVKKMLAIDGLGVIPAATHSVSRQVAAGELIEIGKIDSVFEEVFLVAKQGKKHHNIAESLVKTFCL